MALFNVFDIAGSSLSAQSLRLNVTASNLANADSASSSVDTTYRARQPVLPRSSTRRMGDGAAVGVRVRGIVESQAPLRGAYEPAHPLAGADGYVNYPNVNVVEEMANMISASRSYQSSVEVMNTGKQLLLRTLTLGQ
ncbi:MAG: flagellar basal body rod protein FlgC [Chromatiales bacterium]|nr:flagellar basal body rod protein FlgC [Chromatiales bacterium]